jgi:large subunit ribosomal protein L29
VKASSLRELTRSELHHKLDELEEEYFNMKFRVKTKQLDNPLKLRITRRNIARIKSVLSEDSKGIFKLPESSTGTEPK